MDITVHTSFRANYTAEQSCDYAATRPWVPQRYRVFAVETSRLDPNAEHYIGVTLAGGDRFLLQLQARETDQRLLTVVSTCPNPDQMLVIDRGLPALVDVRLPPRVCAIRDCSVVFDVQCLVERGLLVLTAGSGAACLDTTGCRWACKLQGVDPDAAVVTDTTVELSLDGGGERGLIDLDTGHGQRQAARRRRWLPWARPDRRKLR